VIAWLISEAGGCSSSKWQQPHRPQVTAIVWHQRSGLPG
jgi:hypothetical protein